MTTAKRRPKALEGPPMLLRVETGEGALELRGFVGGRFVAMVTVLPENVVSLAQALRSLADSMTAKPGRQLAHKAARMKQSEQPVAGNKDTGGAS